MRSLQAVLGRLAKHLGPDRRDSKRGGRLLRTTFAAALLLVGGGLITSGAVELFFRYRESVAAIAVLQREMAQGAAFKIGSSSRTSKRRCGHPHRPRRPSPPG